MSLSAVCPKRESFSLENVNKINSVLNLLVAIVKNFTIRDICNLRELNREWKKAVHSNRACVSTLTVFFTKRCGLNILHIGPKDRHSTNLPGYLDPSLQRIPLYLSVFKELTTESERKLDADCNLLSLLKNMTVAIVQNGNLENLLIEFILAELRRNYPSQYDPESEVSSMRAKLGRSDEALENLWKLKTHQIVDTYCEILEAKMASCKAKNVEIDKEEMKKLIAEAKSMSKSKSTFGIHSEDLKKSLCKLAKIEAVLGFWQDAIETLKEASDTRSSDSESAVKSIVEALVKQELYEVFDTVEIPGVYPCDTLPDFVEALIRKGNLSLARVKLNDVGFTKKSHLCYLLALEQIKQSNFEGLTELCNQIEEKAYKIRVLIEWSKKLTALNRNEEAKEVLERAKKLSSETLLHCVWIDAEKGDFESLFVYLDKQTKGWGSIEFEKGLEGLIKLLTAQNRSELLAKAKTLIDSLKVEYRSRSLIMVAKAEVGFKMPEYKNTIKKALECVSLLKDNQEMTTDKSIEVARAQHDLGDKEEAKQTLYTAIDQLKGMKGEYIIDQLIKYCLALAEFGDCNKASEVLANVHTLHSDFYRNEPVKQKITYAIAKVKMYSGDIKGAIQYINDTYPKSHDHYGYNKIDGYKQLLALYYKHNGTFVVV